MLTLEPFGGLGNRMRAIASGLDLAERAGHELRLIWIQDPSIACSFSSLFCPIPGVSLVDVHSSPRGLSSLGSLLSRVRTRAQKIFGLQPEHDLDLGQDDIDRMLREHSDLVGLIRERKTPKVRTYSQFLSFENRISALVPTERLQKRIDELSQKIEVEKCIGLHIRRGDHLEAIKNSPTSAFVALIQNHKDGGDTKFFLSTDDVQVEAELCRSFDIQTIAKSSFRRDTMEGIQQALVEMILLSRCRKIYGSSGSSFSEIASKMGRTPLEVVTAMGDPQHA